MGKADEIKAKAVIQGEEWERGREIYKMKKSITNLLFSIWTFSWWFIVLLKWLIGSPFKLWVSLSVWIVIGGLIIGLIQGTRKRIKE